MRQAYCFQMCCCDDTGEQRVQCRREARTVQYSWSHRVDLRALLPRCSTSHCGHLLCQMTWVMALHWHLNQSVTFIFTAMVANMQHKQSEAKRKSHAGRLILSQPSCCPNHS